jgi:wyosine [tRNA(Phe)-imidazoG37] synthetase (radical SAM superfamily)
MKNKILTFAVVALMLGTGFNTFGQTDKKVNKARKEVKEAQMDLKEAKVDSAADYEKFRKEAEMDISDNNTKIANLKSIKRSDDKSANEKYDKKLMALEQRNNDLKNKLNGSSSTKTSAWSSFKREFNHDMSEFGKAFKDIGVNNEK